MNPQGMESREQAHEEQQGPFGEIYFDRDNNVMRFELDFTVSMIALGGSRTCVSRAEGEDDERPRKILDDSRQYRVLCRAP